MPLWQWLVDSAGALLLLLALVAALLVLRRRALSRGGGTFELSLRESGKGTPEDGRGWVLGLGRYRDDSLEWFRIFSPLPVPKRSWQRHELAFRRQREPTDAERYALYEGSVVVICSTPKGEVELAMGPSSMTGLQVWLEAGPPGYRATP